MFEQYGLHIAIACAAVAILYGIFVARWIVGQPAGNDCAAAFKKVTQEGRGLIDHGERRPEIGCVSRELWRRHLD